MTLVSTRKWGRIACVALAAILSGCLGWKKFGEDLQQYQGGKIEAMVTRFGAPDHSVDLPGEPIRVAYTWWIRNRGGEHVCDVTAIADKQNGEIAKVTDNCRHLG
jgi:hypothetical protein